MSTHTGTRTRTRTHTHTHTHTRAHPPSSSSEQQQQQEQEPRHRGPRPPPPPQLSASHLSLTLDEALQRLERRAAQMSLDGDERLATLLELVDDAGICISDDDGGDGAGGVGGSGRVDDGRTGKRDEKGKGKAVDRGKQPAAVNQLPGFHEHHRAKHADQDEELKVVLEISRRQAEIDELQRMYGHARAPSGSSSSSSSPTTTAIATATAKKHKPAASLSRNPDTANDEAIAHALATEWHLADLKENGGEEDDEGYDEDGSNAKRRQRKQRETQTARTGHRRGENSVASESSRGSRGITSSHHRHNQQQQRHRRPATRSSSSETDSLSSESSGGHNHRRGMHVPIPIPGPAQMPALPPHAAVPPQPHMVQISPPLIITARLNHPVVPSPPSSGFSGSSEEEEEEEGDESSSDDDGDDDDDNDDDGGDDKHEEEAAAVGDSKALNKSQRNAENGIRAKAGITNNSRNSNRTGNPNAGANVKPNSGTGAGAYSKAEAKTNAKTTSRARAISYSSPSSLSSSSASSSESSDDESDDESDGSSIEGHNNNPYPRIFPPPFPHFPPGFPFDPLTTAGFPPFPAFPHTFPFAPPPPGFPFTSDNGVNSTRAPRGTGPNWMMGAAPGVPSAGAHPAWGAGYGHRRDMMGRTGQMGQVGTVEDRERGRGRGRREEKMLEGGKGEKEEKMQVFTPFKMTSASAQAREKAKEKNGGSARGGGGSGGGKESDEAGVVKRKERVPETKGDEKGEKAGRKESPLKTPNISSLSPPPPSTAPRTSIPQQSSTKNAQHILPKKTARPPSPVPTRISYGASSIAGRSTSHSRGSSAGSAGWRPLPTPPGPQGLSVHPLAANIHIHAPTPTPTTPTGTHVQTTRSSRTVPHPQAASASGVGVVPSPTTAAPAPTPASAHANAHVQTAAAKANAAFASVLSPLNDLPGLAHPVTPASQSPHTPTKTQSRGQARSFVIPGFSASPIQAHPPAPAPPSPPSLILTSSQLVGPSVGSSPTRSRAVLGAGMDTGMRGTSRKMNKSSFSSTSSGGGLSSPSSSASTSPISGTHNNAAGAGADTKLKVASSKRSRTSTVSSVAPTPTKTRARSGSQWEPPTTNNPLDVLQLKQYQHIFTVSRNCTKCGHECPTPRQRVYINPRKCPTSQPIILMLHITCSKCSAVHCRGCFAPLPNCPPHECVGTSESPDREQQLPCPLLSSPSSHCPLLPVIAIYEILDGFDTAYLSEPALLKPALVQVRRQFNNDIVSQRTPEKVGEFPDIEKAFVRALQALSGWMPKNNTGRAHPSILHLFTHSFLMEIVRRFLTADNLWYWIYHSRTYTAIFKFLLALLEAGLGKEVVDQPFPVISVGYGLREWMWGERALIWEMHRVDDLRGGGSSSVRGKDGRGSGFVGGDTVGLDQMPPLRSLYVDLEKRRNMLARESEKLSTESWKRDLRSLLDDMNSFLMSSLVM